MKPWALGQTDSGSYLAFNDFSTGIIQLPLGESLGRQPGGMFIFVSAVTPNPTARELPGREANLRHKG